MKMKTVIIKNNSSITISPGDKKEIDKIVELYKRGTYYSQGRTCYYKLNNVINVDGIDYLYVKIKGCGCYENDGTITHPGLKPYYRKDPHFGISELGHPILLCSDVAPYGGILLNRAVNEFDNFTILRKNNVSTLLPLYVYKYTDLTFNGNELGVSVSLCESVEPFRFDKLLQTNDLMSTEYKNFYQDVYESQFNKRTQLDINDKYRLIKRIGFLYGNEIRNFCNSGLYIHSGGWSNIQYSFKNKRVVLIDLDSSRIIQNESLRMLQNCRDITSNIYRLFINMYNPNCIKDYSNEIILDTNYVYSILRGFCYNADNKELVDISNRINNYYIENCFNRIKKIENVMNEISDDEAKKYELDIMKFYDFCMTELSDVMLRENTSYSSCIRYKRR